LKRSRPAESRRRCQIIEKHEAQAFVTHAATHAAHAPDVEGAWEVYPIMPGNARLWNSFVLCLFDLNQKYEMGDIHACGKGCVCVCVIPSVVVSHSYTQYLDTYVFMQTHIRIP
jgi:hypothetical protein